MKKPASESDAGLLYRKSIIIVIMKPEIILMTYLMERRLLQKENCSNWPSFLHLQRKTKRRQTYETLNFHHNLANSIAFERLWITTSSHI